MNAFLAAFSENRALRLAAAAGIAVRVGIFIAATIWPIPNERGALVSPLMSQSYLDFEFYLESMRRYASEWPTIVDDFLSFYRGLAGGGAIISGPIFPLLMSMFGFADGNYLPLAMFYVALSSVVAIGWLWWLSHNGVGGIGLLIFAVLPNPVWFVLVVSPDLLFAAEFMIFFLAYFSVRRGRLQTATWVSAMLFMLLTRPNGFSVVFFVTLDAGWSFFRSGRIKVARAVGILLALVGSGLYLYPYFVFEMSKAGNALQYFGQTPAAYVAGIFHGLPAWLDRPLSWIALFAAKLLYFTGLRPSYGVTPPILVALRGAAGLVLLPGLLALMMQAPRREKALVGLYCLPFLLGPSQDRYYLAVLPLLFLYGVRFWAGVADRLGLSMLGSANAPGGRGT